MEVPNTRRETIYGMPAADQVMFNRHFVIGYSYYFRQAKWALEIIDPDNSGLDRLDNFRSDFRVPEMFRADLVDYFGSSYDCGHLVASANQRETRMQNSEIFLLSNMSPQELARVTTASMTVFITKSSFDAWIQLTRSSCGRNLRASFAWLMGRTQKANVLYDKLVRIKWSFSQEWTINI